MEIKKIEGYNYHITSNGDVFSYHCNKLLKPRLNKGYFYVNLSNNGKMKTFKIHRLVAESFLPNHSNLPIVNHKDGNKQNNHVDNLEWCTHSENTKHAVLMGLLKPPNPSGSWLKNYTLSRCIKVICVNTGEIFNSISEAAFFANSESKNPTSKVKEVCDGIRKSYKGYVFKYHIDGESVETIPHGSTFPIDTGMEAEN